MKAKIIKIYLDWVNNWLTLNSIADHYGMDIGRMNKVLLIGERLINKNFPGEWIRVKK